MEGHARSAIVTRDAIVVREAFGEPPFATRVKVRRRGRSGKGRRGGWQPGCRRPIFRAMKILVTGGTGTLGRAVVAAVRASGAVARVPSRRDAPAGGARDVEWVRADLASGAGLADAVAGVDAVIHAASDSTRAEEVDVAGTRRLVAAARAARVGHIVYVSIVGIDEMPSVAYYRCKLGAEWIIATGGVPWSVLRATQFHSFVAAIIATADRVPFVLPLPTAFRFQSVDEREVAERLVQAAGATPAGRLPDLAGPEVMTLGAAAREWKEVTGVRKPVLAVPTFGDTAAAFKAGRNMRAPATGGLCGGETGS